MKKYIFNVLLLLPFMFSLFGCSLETNINGEFLLENYFKLVKEFDGETECPEDEKWFNFSSTFYVHSDETYELLLNYKMGKELTFTGEYKIYVGDIGHSGKGYFVMDDIKIDLVFQNSYYLIFELPSNFIPDGYTNSHTLHFQRWG